MKIDAANLEGAWIHSHEEDTPDRLVFRPLSWRLPPSRGRRVLELGPEGHLVAGGPDAVDRFASAHGHWRLLDGGTLEIEEGGKVSRIQVLEVTGDKLVAERRR
jgi:hypothetical protein